MQKLRWGILSTGFIAGRFAEGIASSNTGVLTAVSSRSLESAETFARQHGGCEAYGSHAELLSQESVDAVYVASPHPFHAEMAIAAAKAGKHILCEKPIAMNMQETEAIIAAAKAAGVILVEAYMYRCHPQTAKVAQIIRDGIIGDVKLVQAAFGFHAPYDPKGRLFAKELGGGGILDVGGYTASFACMVADLASGGTETEVACVGGAGQLDTQCGTDTLAIANLRFSNGVCAQISCSTQLAQNNHVRIYGTKGWIDVAEPWIVTPHGGDWSIELHLADQDQAETIRGHESRELYGVEADTFARLVAGEKPDAPYMSLSDTKRVNQILADWLGQIAE
ncbi:Gfo/Idh/MocA family oxidoreductase [Pelagicoccus sp. SDUM812002]|uniref:Gfo/Idh/MocA family protein n=1 Tax=Pelagicoccus sp. SDUM812002 TaxID=3041266 RepID=UPI002810177C|nr:Gfo/Idh/MocA family oxidoreductase [Pelagicoccus sp. SDUM812002]MDQ8188265.1 Gfo/Idh/MocA family oxidoreductase [Pelagicoccus sp. SDUM812002]